jgi:hypothetical protein
MDFYEFLRFILNLDEFLSTSVFFRQNSTINSLDLIDLEIYLFLYRINFIQIYKKTLNIDYEFFLWISLISMNLDIYIYYVRILHIFMSERNIEWNFKNTFYFLQWNCQKSQRFLRLRSVTLWKQWNFKHTNVFFTMKWLEIRSISIDFYYDLEIYL